MKREIAERESIPTYILDMVKAQRRALASVLQRFRGESLVMAMMEASHTYVSKGIGLAICLFVS